MESKVLEKLGEYDRVLVVGSYPPPLGGVSVHIYRLEKVLKNLTIFDLFQKNRYKGENYIKLFKEIIGGDYDAIHIHSYDMKLIILMLFLKKIKKFNLIATSHNPRLFEINCNFKKRLFKKFIEKLDVLVVVGKHILIEYRKNSVNLPKNIIIESAFMPPPIEEEYEILDTYPKDLDDFLSSHSPIIVANGFRIVFYHNIDLYGLDLCIELTAKLKDNFPNIGFIFALADEHVHKEYLEKSKKRIHELSIEENFYFLTGQKELWPLFKNVDIMVRPTMTDGDALSIREALYFGCSAIASNVSDRPKGVILFKNRNLEDLYKKVEGILNEKYNF